MALTRNAQSMQRKPSGLSDAGMIIQPTETLGAFRYGNECDWPCVTG